MDKKLLRKELNKNNLLSLLMPLQNRLKKQDNKFNSLKIKNKWKKELRLSQNIEK